MKHSVRDIFELNAKIDELAGGLRLFLGSGNYCDEPYAMYRHENPLTVTLVRRPDGDRMGGRQEWHTIQADRYR